jgi:hypothetical protein
MMCSFKPGDDVIAVLDLGEANGLASPPVGWVGIVTWVCPHPFLPDVWGIDLDNWPLEKGHHHDAGRFRKVERRTDRLSIEAFLTIKPGFEEPRRAPAKKRERVQ